MPGVVRQMHEHHLFSHIRWPCCQNQNVSNLFLTKIFSFHDRQLGTPLDGANTQPLDFLKRDFGTSEKGWDQRAEGHGARSQEQHKVMKAVFEVHAYQVIVSTEQFVEAIEPFYRLVIYLCVLFIDCTITEERAIQLKEWLRNNAQPLSQVEQHMLDTAVYRSVGIHWGH